MRPMASASRPMLKYLGIAVREARVQAGVSTARIAAEADVSDAMVRRFEAGRSWPTKRSADEMVRLYAEQTGANPVAIWQRAVQLLEQGD